MTKDDETQAANLEFVCGLISPLFQILKDAGSREYRIEELNDGNPLGIYEVGPAHIYSDGPTYDVWFSDGYTKYHRHSFFFTVTNQVRFYRWVDVFRDEPAAFSEERNSPNRECTLFPQSWEFYTPFARVDLDYPTRWMAAKMILDVVMLQLYIVHFEFGDPRDKDEHAPYKHHYTAYLTAIHKLQEYYNSTIGAAIKSEMPWLKEA